MAAISLFRNRFLSRATKILLYKTLIGPIVTYGAETWTMTKKEEKALLIFERKIFKIIYGPKYKNGEWKSRTNRELEELSFCFVLLGRCDPTRVMASSFLRFLDHTQRRTTVGRTPLEE